jgi:hypothetical protein
MARTRGARLCTARPDLRLLFMPHLMNLQLRTHGSKFCLDSTQIYILGMQPNLLVLPLHNYHRDLSLNLKSNHKKNYENGASNFLHLVGHFLPLKYQFSNMASLRRWQHAISLCRRWPRSRQSCILFPYLLDMSFAVCPEHFS